MLLVLWGCGAAVAAAACLHLGADAWRPAVLIVVVLAAGVAVRRELTVLHAAVGRGRLSFDGEKWSLAGRDAPHTARLDIAIDFQSLMLLQLVEPGRRRRWIWLDRAAAPERWKALRRAANALAP